jgi:hypothetical protein
VAHLVVRSLCSFVISEGDSHNVIT